MRGSKRDPATWRGGARTEALQAAHQWLAARAYAPDDFDWLCERLLADFDQHYANDPAAPVARGLHQDLLR